MTAEFQTLEIRHGHEHVETDGAAFEIEAYRRLVPTQGRIEGVEAFNRKRRPLLKGR